MGLLLTGLLSACDQLGIDTPQKVAERVEAESKAIGGACRNALRAIEDCYTLNPKADKAAMYAGWREMDEYMRENKLEGVRPVIPRPPAKGPRAADGASEADNGGDDTSAKGADDAAASGPVDEHADGGKATQKAH